MDNNFDKEAAKTYVLLPSPRDCAACDRMMDPSQEGICSCGFNNINPQSDPEKWRNKINRKFKIPAGKKDEPGFFEEEESFRGRIDDDEEVQKTLYDEIPDLESRIEIDQNDNEDDLNKKDKEDRIQQGKAASLRCAACGTDYCTGHEPESIDYHIIISHASEDHSSCHPDGCDFAGRSFHAHVCSNCGGDTPCMGTRTARVCDTFDGFCQACFVSLARIDLVALDKKKLNEHMRMRNVGHPPVTQDEVDQAMGAGHSLETAREDVGPHRPVESSVIENLPEWLKDAKTQIASDAKVYNLDDYRPSRMQRMMDWGNDLLEKGEKLLFPEERHLTDTEPSTFVEEEDAPTFEPISVPKIIEKPYRAMERYFGLDQPTKEGSFNLEAHDTDEPHVHFEDLEDEVQEPTIMDSLKDSASRLEQHATQLEALMKAYPQDIDEILKSFNPKRKPQGFVEKDAGIGSDIFNHLQNMNILHPDDAAAKAMLLYTGVTAPAITALNAGYRYLWKDVVKSDPWHVENVRKVNELNKQTNNETAFKTEASYLADGLAAYTVGSGLYMLIKNRQRANYKTPTIFSDKEKRKAFDNQQCHACNQSATEFRDDKSRENYQNYAYCQDCQDAVNSFVTEKDTTE